MQQPELFTILPDYISTPDGMEIDAEGNLVLSCPNFAQPETSGVVVKIDSKKNIRKWFDVPVSPETHVARNMGIAFGPDGDLYLCDNQGWSGEKDLQFKGRLLRVRANEQGDILKTTVVADGMEHPNGVKVYGDYLYVTQSALSRIEDPSGKLVSGVYRFHLDDANISVSNTLADENLLVHFITENPECQYGADGLDFDREGNLYIGNFGDGAVHQVTFDAQGQVQAQRVIAKDARQLKTTDGFCFDDHGNLYIADFSDNAICCMTPDHQLHRMAQSPDCDGLDGGLDQPGEPRVWQGKIIVSCFDLVTDPDKVNTAHEMPATLAMLDLYHKED